MQNTREDVALLVERKGYLACNEFLVVCEVLDWARRVEWYYDLRLRSCHHIKRCSTDFMPTMQGEPMKYLVSYPHAR
jgi:hypothetical protein